MVFIFKNQTAIWLNPSSAISIVSFIAV